MLAAVVTTFLYRRVAACALALCRQLLGDADTVGDIVAGLIDDGDNGGNDLTILGLQLCFNAVDARNRAFGGGVAAHLLCPEAKANKRRVEMAPGFRLLAAVRHFANVRHILTCAFTL